MQLTKKSNIFMEILIFWVSRKVVKNYFRPATSRVQKY